MLTLLRNKMRKLKMISRKRTTVTTRKTVQTHVESAVAKTDENRKDDLYTSFTNDLLRRFYASKKDKNIVFSPFSVLMLLGILARSSEGVTQLEIEDVLGGSDTIDEKIKWLKKLQGELTDSGALLSSHAVCINNEIAKKITPG